jgi:hypothetical protein
MMSTVILAPKLRTVKGIEVTARKGRREWTFRLPWGNGRRREALAFLAGLRDEGVEEIIVHNSIILERREDYVDSER